ncbi:MAG: DUF2993 domain-containing protein [Elainellaceae cyanobacterium]
MSGDLGKEALSNLAEVGIESQLEQVDNVDVKLDASPAEVVQGKVNAVQIDGKGMEMQDGLHMAEMHLETGPVDLDVMRALFGEVTLEQPAQASAQVVLTEKDINRAFNSEFIRQKMQRLKISVDGQPIQVDVQGVEFMLSDSGKIQLTAWLKVEQTHEKTAFIATPRVSADRHQVLLEDIEFPDGDEFSPELTQALLQQSSELLDLRNFELEGMHLRLRKLSIQHDAMTLSGEADITQFLPE